MSITSIGAVPPVRVTGGAPAPILAVPSVPAPLPPAVRFDIRTREQGEAPRAAPAATSESLAETAEPTTEARIRIDRDTKAVVYQEVDPSSGDVVIQLPDPVVLKARAYAEAAEARARPATRPLDRTA